MKNLQNFSHPMDFSWSTNMGNMTCSLNTWGIYISAICTPEYGCHLCFTSPPQLWVHLRATSGRILMNLFFRRHVCVSVMCGTVYKRDFYVSIFRWLLFICYLHRIHTLYTILLVAISFYSYPITESWIWILQRYIKHKYLIDIVFMIGFGIFCGFFMKTMRIILAILKNE